MLVCISLIKYVICRFFLLRDKDEPSEFCFSQFASSSLSVGRPWHRVEKSLEHVCKGYFWVCHHILVAVSMSVQHYFNVCGDKRIHVHLLKAYQGLVKIRMGEIHS